jgi:hypothetical protein
VFGFHVGNSEGGRFDVRRFCNRVGGSKVASCQVPGVEDSKNGETLGSAGQKKAVTIEGSDREKMVAGWAAPLEKTVYGENSDKASSFF